jgi:hypothetical protein
LLFLSYVIWCNKKWLVTQDSDEYDGPLGVLQVLAYGRKLLLKTYKEKRP